MSHKLASCYDDREDNMFEGELRMKSRQRKNGQEKGAPLYEE